MLKFTFFSSFKETAGSDSYYDSDNFDGTPEKKTEERTDSDDEERRRHDSEVDGKAVFYLSYFPSPSPYLACVYYSGICTYTYIVYIITRIV